MRISDWCSDVCSSDFEVDVVLVQRMRRNGDARGGGGRVDTAEFGDAATHGDVRLQHGDAALRHRRMMRPAPAEKLAGGEGAGEGGGDAGVVGFVLRTDRLLDQAGVDREGLLLGMSVSVTVVLGGPQIIKK